MMITGKKDRELLTEKEVAEKFGISVKTLQDWRQDDPEKLPFIKIGRLVRYRLETIEKFLIQNSHGTTRVYRR